MNDLHRVFLSEKEVFNAVVISKIAKAKLKTGFLKIAKELYPGEYDHQDAVDFADKYSGKWCNLIRDGNDWFVLEDNNILVPELCIAEFNRRASFTFSRNFKTVG